MSGRPVSTKCETVIHLKNVPRERAVRSYIESRCAELTDAFPETSKIEFSLTHEGGNYAVRAHVSGRGVGLVTTRSESREAGAAANGAIEKLEIQLRRHHDRMQEKDRHRLSADLDP